MHITTLFILKGYSLNDIGKMGIEEMFSERFCYNCGDSTPKYRYWCDWFQIGGRWNDRNVLHATKGLHGENGCGEGYTKPKYVIAEIKDLKGKLNTKMIGSIATLSRVYVKEENKDKFDKLINDIDNKRFNGIVALLDCHD